MGSQTTELITSLPQHHYPEGPDFSQATNPGPKARTSLPQAGVQREAV
jgi:hypothetical protein